MSSDLDELRATWTQLYAQILPSLARAHDPSQPRWPVTLDHCFARIILDNTVGGGERQWDQVLKRPAVKNMTEGQLREAIGLARRIERGEVGLVVLDEQSLRVRGKEAKYGGKTDGEGKKEAANSGKKRKLATALNREAETAETNAVVKRAKPTQRQSTLSFKPSTNTSNHLPSAPPSLKPSKPNYHPPNSAQILHKISTHHSLTPYRKRLYAALLSVPLGRYTTYAKLSDFLNSSARAVGNGMRNNPFAPEVPCHRVLAADGSIGGFRGDWGKDGKHAREKIKLLREEGVRFDGRGRVVGEPFWEFHEFGVE